MGIEAQVEQGIKTALQAFTDTLAPDDNPTYRCFYLDDETDTGRTTEPKEYPMVRITASPNVPTFHKATFRDIPVELMFATHKSADKKRAKLVALYEGCRAIVDAESTVSVSGYNLTGIIIESGGESGVDENEQYITLPLTVKICGA